MAEAISDPAQQEIAATSAAKATARCLAANLRAVRAVERNLAEAVEQTALDIEWVYARDGSLTALTHGSWWAGCSLPKKAAAFMLKKADLSAGVICFLAPSHAAQLRVCLDRMHPSQAIIALSPSLETLKILLACDDFSSDITTHRLYFASGENWEAELDRLLENTPGLQTPTAFVRPILADTLSADALIDPAQKVFFQQTQRRLQKITTARTQWKRRPIKKICLIAPSQFRLWDDTGHAMCHAITKPAGETSWVRFDSDDPASASALALAQVAAECDAIIAPGASRASLPEIIHTDMPWATWITTPRIPPRSRVGPRDTLLLTDPSWKTLAAEAGWPADRIFIAGWPREDFARTGGQVPDVFVMPKDPSIAIISHTHRLDPPTNVKDFSSQRLLWESIADQLLNNPLAVGESIDAFLDEQIKIARLDEMGLDRGSFRDTLIPAALSQGFARLLIAEKIPLKLFGKGWDELPEFREHAVGPINSREQLQLAVHSSTALLHVSPGTGAHPIESLGKPVVRNHRRRESLMRSVQSAFTGRLATPAREMPALSAQIMMQSLSLTY